MYQFQLHFNKRLIEANYFSAPWNQNTILGWIGSVTVSVLSSMVVFPLYGILLSFFVLCYEYNKSFLLTFVDLAIKLNQHIQKRNLSEIKLVLCDLIKYNIIGKE